MTHLKIELNTGITEQVSSAVILKLYNVVTNNTLDNTSHLLGSLNTDATYQTYIDVLTDRTNSLTEDLYITATKKYLMFEDPEIERVIMAKNIGDGVGLTLLDLSSITSMLSEFWNNTTITSANDLLHFTSLTSLFNRPFLGCTNLTSVVMPLSLITLSNVTFDPAFGGAFKNCTSLTSVTLNEGLLQIACQAFYGCTSLQTIDIPSTVTKLAGSSYNNSDGYGAFCGCSALTTVTGGENITQIGPITFQNCSNLTSLPDFNFANITNIGTGAFYGCQNLQLGNLSLPSLNLSKIHYRTFYNCKRLTSITLPSTVTEIDGVENWLAEGIFRNCTALTTVTAPGLTKIGESAFYGCTSLTNIDLSNITHIGNNTFYGCSNLGLNLDLDITLDEYCSGMFYGTGYRSVTLHCNQAYTYNITGNNYAPFSNMSNLLKLDFSDTKMDKFALTNAPSLTTLILPTTMTQILWNSFSGTNNTLLYIVILANNVVPLESADYMLNGLYHPNANVYVPDNLVSLYQGATNWSDISTRIKGISELPSSVTWYTQNNP